MKNFKGTFTALVTPFTSDNRIDKKSFERLLQQQLDGGVDGFVINGTTAESPTLREEEKYELFDIAKSFSGGKAVLIMGTGSNDTAKTIEDSKKAEKKGADALLVVVPYYNKPPQRGLYAHFKNVAESVSIPTLLYNVPGRTITSLETETIQKLSQLKNVIGIKEATGKIDFAEEIIRACGNDFTLLSGDDATYVEFLAKGGHGVISVATHVLPRQMVQWKNWVHEGALEKARAGIAKYNPLIQLLFCEANPIPVKKALQLMGVIDQDQLRLPLVGLTENWTQELRAEMLKVGVLA